ncbi:hypothetical protein BC628DRAFT_1355416 [Trametes gibbosa]|nr:hypothetical protein BC628DRAFT_1355416 [Trametes gibbosa]
MHRQALIIQLTTMRSGSCSVPVSCISISKLTWRSLPPMHIRQVRPSRYTTSTPDGHGICSSVGGRWSLHHSATTGPHG